MPMIGRRTNIAVVTLTAVAALVAEFGQVGCHASCVAAAIGKAVQCPLSCCSQKRATRTSCCAASDHTGRTCGENCPQCPVCRAPTRAITSSKAMLLIPVDAAWDLPTGLVSKMLSRASARMDSRRNKLIAALHPPLQVLNCIWRN